MFDALRKMILPIILIVLFFFIAMIVLEWGLGMSTRQDFEAMTSAAVINGEEVDWAVYNQIYSNLYNNAVMSSPEGDVSDQQAEELQEQAWNQLLYDRLLMQEARKYNFSVTDEELYAFLRFSPPPELQSMAYFQTDGQFDYQKYLNTMVDPQAATFWGSIEPSMRRELLKLKVQDMILQSVHVSEDEVRDAFLASNERVKVAMLNVPYAQFTNPPPQPTEEQMRAWYDEHKEKYQLDERASLKMVILQKEPEEADWMRQRQAAEAILDSLRNGADFAEMAQRYSDGPSATDGGDLGWFRQGQMVPPFDRAVRSMEEGALSEPIRTNFGWHIIKKHDEREREQVNPATNQTEMMPEFHASHILLEVKVSPETLDELYRRSESFRSLALEQGFQTAAEQMELTVDTTTRFRRNANIQYVGFHPQANRFAFTAEPDAISPVMESDNAVFVAVLNERIPAGIASFEEAKSQVSQDLLVDIVASQCREKAQTIYSSIQNGMSLQQAAEEFDAEFAEVGPFTRSATVPRLRSDPAPIGAAFNLDSVGAISQPVDFSQGTVILQLLEKTNPDLSEFTTRRDSLYQSVMQRKRGELLNSWLQKLVEESEIINNVERARDEEFAANEM